jgi:polar amino acid transport system substrate-binding protein
MMPPMSKRMTVLVPVVAALLATSGCAPAEDKPAAGGAPGNCDKASLATLKQGVLTFGTDQPAYPPWFVGDVPANGKGFESAVAYAVAGKLGYQPSEVAWVRVPFNAAIAPGPKTFDANLNEFSITDERRKAVDGRAVLVEAGRLQQAKSLRFRSRARRAADVARKRVRLGCCVGD